MPVSYLEIVPQKTAEENIMYVESRARQNGR